MFSLASRPLARLPLLASLAVATALLFPGCTFLKLARSEKLKQPEITYLRFEVKSVAQEKAVVDFILNAKNPNKIGLKNVFVDYELFHEGRMFLKGNEIALSLAPSGDTEIRIPAEVAYGDVLMTTAAVTQRVIAGEKTVPVRIDAVVFGKPTLYNEKEEGSLFSFSHKLSRTENIPLPEKQMDEATDVAKDRALKELRKRF